MLAVNYEQASVIGMPDAPADFIIQSGDEVVYHADGGDFEAKCVRVDPATRYCAETYWLWLLTEKLPVKAQRERLSIVLTAKAAALSSV